MQLVHDPLASALSVEIYSKLKASAVTPQMVLLI